MRHQEDLSCLIAPVSYLGPDLRKTKIRMPKDASHAPVEPKPQMKAQNWVKILAKYREPNTGRSLTEVAITLVPFIGIWALAWWAMSVSYILAFVLGAANALFLLRLFAIQHDCGHGALFKNRHLSDWTGRIIGVLTLTPYDVWRRTHAAHHGTAGNLDKRGMGDIHTMTVEEYRGLSKLGKLQYRLYRNPFVLFGFGPSYLFFLQNRLPIGLMKQGRYWASAMTTNLSIVVLFGVIWYFGGLAPLLLIALPSILIAATAGMWLFYVQHQFECTQWAPDTDWQLHHAALHGSSYYVLPKVLQWFSANIGIHHVHHVYSRIPFYRLPEVLKDHAELAKINRMNIRESLVNARLHLWDDKTQRLLSFAQARQLYG